MEATASFHLMTLMNHAGRIFTLQRLLFILNSAVLRVPYGHYFGMSRKWSCFVLANYPLKHVIWVFLFLN